MVVLLVVVVVVVVAAVSTTAQNFVQTAAPLRFHGSTASDHSERHVTGTR